MPPRRIEVDSGSEDDFVSDNDDLYDEGRIKKGKGRASDRKKSRKGKNKAAEAYAWEATYTRSWDAVREDESGSLQGAVDELIARGRRRRLLFPSDAIRRTIIRHMVIILDLSASMLDRDMRPTRFDLALECTRAFVSEWFDQNPLGQVAVIGMRSGIAERLGEMSGSPQDVLKSIQERHRLEPAGEPSLQNAIEMARSSMSHLPSHSSREIVLIFGSLTSVDPGNIHDSVSSCTKDKIRISVIALAAEMKICREMCDKTGGQFGVALNEGHFRDLLFELIPPPAQRALARISGTGSNSTPSSSSANPSADLMLMGFPTRVPATSAPALCVCHAALRSAGFICPRCSSRLCDVPTDCDVCGLMVVSAPHLARSYHHLFPVKPYQAVSDLGTSSSSSCCHGCAVPFPKSVSAVGDGLSPIGRYKCPECKNDFCTDCDVFVHDVVHCCPGCGR